MIIDAISLILGAVFGFIIGIALIKESSAKLVHEYKEENIRLQYEIRGLEDRNKQLRTTLNLLDDDTLKLYRKSDGITILANDLDKEED